MSVLAKIGKTFAATALVKKDDPEFGRVAGSNFAALFGVYAAGSFYVGEHSC